MAKFFVGQRVRVVGAYSDHGRAFIGREAVIVDMVDFPSWDEPIYGLDISACELRPDGWWGWGPDCLARVLPPKPEACEPEFKRDLDRMLERECAPALAGAATRSSDPAPAHQGAAA